MDPNETLNNCRGQARAILDRDATADPEALAEAFDNLDAWLVRGGFLPQSWQAEEIEACDCCGKVVPCDCRFRDVDANDPATGPYRGIVCIVCKKEV